MTGRGCGKLQLCMDTHVVRSCGKLQLCMDTHVVRSCGKLQQSDGSDVEKSLLKGKRDGEFGSVSSQEQERFLSERQHQKF